MRLWLSLLTWLSVHMISLQQVIWPQGVWIWRWSVWVLLRRSRVLHVLRNHILVVLINRVVLVTVGVDINFVELMVDFWLEELLHHLPSILCRKLLSQSQQELILVTLSPLGQLSEGILEVLHRVVSELQEKLDHVLGVLLGIASIYVHGSCQFLILERML